MIRQRLIFFGNLSRLLRFLGDGAITEDEFVSGCKSDGSFLKVKITFCQLKFENLQMEENL